MKTNGTYQEQDPTRAWVRSFVEDVAAGGPGGTYGTPVGRYVVGGWEVSVVLPKAATAGQRVDAALSFASDYADTQRSGLGYWRDAQTGRYWLDVVRTTNDPAQALTWAQDNGELAVFDRNDDRVIRTGDLLSEVANAWGQAE